MRQVVRAVNAVSQSVHTPDASSRQRWTSAVQQAFGDVLHSGHGDTGPLFDSQRMISGLQLDCRASANGLAVHHGLQVQRRWL
jgi:hypothetical protein